MIYNTRIAGIICTICTVIGILYFAISHKWILFRYPSSNTIAYSKPLTKKKQATLFFWQHEKWKSETQDVLWSESIDHNIHTLINTLLNMLEEENILHKKITLQSALLSPSGHEAYLSFDHNPLPKESSTFEKWMIIEGLLKTIRENKIPIQGIQFLVYHQPLCDPHLDYSKPWPIHGFINK